MTSLILENTHWVLYLNEYNVSNDLVFVLPKIAESHLETETLKEISNTFAVLTWNDESHENVMKWEKNIWPSRKGLSGRDKLSYTPLNPQKYKTLFHETERVAILFSVFIICNTACINFVTKWVWHKIRSTNLIFILCTKH